MAEEIEVYKKAFDYACRNSTIDRAVSNTIIQLENRYTLKGDPHHDNQVLKVLFNEEIFQTKLKTAIDEKSKQEEAFEKLKKAVTGNKKIIKQIEGLKRNKGIAIIGNNHDLISGIASYLWLTSPLIYPGTPQIWLEMSPIRQKFFDAVGKYINGEKGFCYINCDGVNETELHKELFKDIVTPPGLPYWVLFLRNINNSHDNIVRRVLGAMRDVGGQGNFIISTDHLPVNLKGQFEVICLETKISFEDAMNQITINNRTFSYLPNREYKLFKLLYQNKDRYVSKEEILQELNVGGEWDESQIFKLITTLRKTLKGCPIIFDNKKQSAYKEGGYQLIIK